MCGGDFNTIRRVPIDERVLTLRLKFTLCRNSKNPRFHTSICSAERPVNVRYSWRMVRLLGNIIDSVWRM